MIWGALHGAALTVERLLGLQRDTPAGVRVLWWVVVQAVVLVTWIFFRSADVTGAWQFVRNIAALQFSPPNDVMWFGSVFLLPPLAMHAWRLLEERQVVPAPAGYGQAALTGAMVFLTIAAYGSTNAFIYFQF